MMQRGALFWTVLGAAAAILTYQLFIPPIVGLADQGDFRRMIGRFGYGPEHSDGRLNMLFVERKYVPDPTFRAPEWEQISSEYLFIAAALLVNNVISKNGRLDITVIGFVHAIAFLAVFARFLIVTKNIGTRTFLWIAALLILTDVSYVAYWNSFYAEPASCLFFLLLLTESIDICQRGCVSWSSLIRWTLWTILLVLAKPQNAPLGILLALFALRLRFWTAGQTPRYGAFLSSAAIASAAVLSVVTAPTELKNACTYNLVFKAILPESRNPSADLEALGMDPNLQDFSGTGAWSPDTAFPALEASGVIGKQVTHGTIVRFYLSRPTRLWRHIQSLLPIALWLRPEQCGNFEPSAGYPPGARSSAFTLWSGFHEQVLSRIAKFVLFLLPVPPLLALVSRSRRSTPQHQLQIEFGALLALCCLTAFLTAAFADAWDNIKHLFLFNLLLDTCLISAAVFAWSSIVTKQRVPKDNFILARSSGI